MKRKILISLITISILLEGAFIYQLFIPTEDQVLEDIKTIDLKKDKSIAIQIQNSDGSWKEAEDRSKWPDPSTHGFIGAECTDSEGTTLKDNDILTFSLTNKTATLKTKQTVYCTLYFATGEPVLEHLKNKGGDTFAGGGQHTTAVDGMYRFKGTTSQVLNNYICFGTTIESTCTENASGNYMYRIIGITSAADTKIGLKANQLKIIRAVPSSTNQAWGSSISDSSTWDASQAKKYLNTTWYNATFVTEDTKIPDASYWDSIISQHGWYIKDQTGTPGTTESKDGATLAGAKDNRIGLMYATDYVNAGAQDTTNWLFVRNGWNGNTAVNEWTMSRYGRTSAGSNYAWTVNDGGILYGYAYVSSTLKVRPVFYLQSGVNLIGEGTKDHPYIITTKNNAN